MSDNTNNDRHNDWLSTFAREAAQRQLLIVDGNVQDIFYDPEQRDYVRLPELLQRVIERQERLGYTMTGLWDQADGLRFKDKKTETRFTQALQHKTTAKANSGSQQAYDIGQSSAPGPEQGRLYAEPTELMPAIRQFTKVDSERLAVILNYTQYLVTAPDRPDPNERNWLLQLKKILAGDWLLSLNSDSLRQNKVLLVLITAKLGNIPPMLYQNDPRVKFLTVPTLSVDERRSFFMRHMDDLRCDRPKPVSEFKAGCTAKDSQEELASQFADHTDHYQMIELRQLLCLSLTTERPLLPEKLINLHRFGDQRSPWEELSQEKLRNAETTLKQRVIGQDQAIRHVVTMMIRAYLGLAGLIHSSKRSKPKGVLFFTGPTGVGKTELAKAIAEFLFGDESAFIRFDMSEYSLEQSDQKLIGAPPGYVGFEEGGQLTNSVRKRPFSVLLFDEVEKGHPRVLDKFLQILEDGRLTDGRGETVYFSECVIIFTSNIGASNMPETDDPKELSHHFATAVKDYFVTKLNRPELLNRIGKNVITFNKITGQEFQQAILQRKIGPVGSYLRERFGVDLSIGVQAVKMFLVDIKSEDGGRGVLNTLERMVINPLALFMFDHLHQLRKGRTISVTHQDNQTHLELQENDNHE